MLIDVPCLYARTHTLTRVYACSHARAYIREICRASAYAKKEKASDRRTMLLAEKPIVVSLCRGTVNRRNVRMIIRNLATNAIIRLRVNHGRTDGRMGGWQRSRAEQQASISVSVGKVL